MYATVMKVTPELATEWLKKNTRNRPIKRSRVEAYKAMILSGRFITTHQGIAFSKEGILLDGQHRLIAVSESGVDVDIFVAFDVPDESYAVIDTQCQRSLHDLVSYDIDESIRDRGVVAFVRIFMIKYLRVFTASYKKADPFIVSEFMKNNEKTIMNFMSLMPIANAKIRAALFAAYVCGAGDDAIFAFSNCYRNNRIYTEYNCKYAMDLKDYMKSGRVTDADETFAFIENTIYAFANNHRKIYNASERRYMDANKFVLWNDI